MRRPVACSSLRARLCSKLCHWSSGWRSSRAHVPACSRPTYLLAVRAATRGGVRSALLLTRGHMDIASVIADKGIFESVSGAAKPSQYQQISGTRRPLWCPGCRDAVVRAHRYLWPQAWVRGARLFVSEGGGGLAGSPQSRHSGSLQNMIIMMIMIMTPGHWTCRIAIDAQLLELARAQQPVDVLLRPPPRASSRPVSCTRNLPHRYPPPPWTWPRRRRRRRRPGPPRSSRCRTASPSTTSARRCWWSAPTRCSFPRLRRALTRPTHPTQRGRFPSARWRHWASRRLPARRHLAAGSSVAAS